MLDHPSTSLINDAAERCARGDIGRVISMVVVCAATRAIDSAKYASVLRQASEFAPIAPLLLRSPDAALDHAHPVFWVMTSGTTGRYQSYPLMYGKFAP